MILEYAVVWSTQCNEIFEHLNGWNVGELKKNIFSCNLKHLKRNYFCNEM